MCPNGVPETSVASTIQSTLAAALSVEGDGLIEGRLHRVAVVGFRVSVSIPYTCRYAVRWLSGRKPRFAKAAGSHGTGLKSTISGRFFIGSLVGVGCRMMGVGPRAGTLVGTLEPMPMCAFRVHVASHTGTGLIQHGRHAIGGDAYALAGRVTGGSFGRSVRYGASGSIQVHVLPDDACDESAASGRIVEEGTDAGPYRRVDAGVGCGRQGVGVGGPDIEGRDLVAVASDEPTKGCEPRFNGKHRIRLGEVAGRPSQRLRIARRRVGESDRLVEQLRILRGGEPLALLTGRVTNEVRQNDAGRPDARRMRSHRLSMSRSLAHGLRQRPAYAIASALRPCAARAFTAHRL